jgi:hypothetical protein
MVTRVKASGLQQLWLASSVVVLLWGCSAVSPPLVNIATVSPTHPNLRLLTQRNGAGEARQVVVHTAQSFVRGAALEVSGYKFSRDPVGFVRAAFWSAGVDLFDARVASDQRLDGIGIIYQSAAARGRLHKQTPQPGDLLFLDGQGHGRDMQPAHLCVIESIDAFGTITALGYFQDGPARIKLNMRYPKQGATGGQAVNDLLKRANSTALAATLFRDFANPY